MSVYRAQVTVRDIGPAGCGGRDVGIGGRTEDGSRIAIMGSWLPAFRPGEIMHITIGREEEGYQGWSSQETWAANLWINNDQGIQEGAMEVLRGIEDRRDRAEALEEYCDEVWLQGEEAPFGLAADLLAHAWGEIDWDEIAEAMREREEE